MEQKEKEINRMNEEHEAEAKRQNPETETKNVVAPVKVIGNVIEDTIISDEQIKVINYYPHIPINDFTKIVKAAEKILKENMSKALIEQTK